MNLCADPVRARPVASMLIAPGPAQRCIESFNGRILFMPSSYSRDAATFPAAGLRSRWEPSLSLTTYYLLVLASLTGLSTLLGQTDVLGAAAQRRRAVRGAERCCVCILRRAPACLFCQPPHLSAPPPPLLLRVLPLPACYNSDARQMPASYPTTRMASMNCSRPR